MAFRSRNILSSFLNRIQFQTPFNIISSRLSAFISTQLTSVLYFSRMRFINSFNQTMALTILTLANLVQLKKTDPFSTHPKAMRVAVSSTILFYLTYTALLCFPLRRRAAIIAGHCLLSIGNASVASLASVLLPDTLSPFIFALFGLLSAAELYHDIWTAFSFFTGQSQPILPL